MENGSIVQNSKNNTEGGMANNAFEMNEQRNNNRDSFDANTTSEIPKISPGLDDGFTENSVPKRRKKVSLNIPEETQSDTTSKTKDMLEFQDLDHDPNDVNILARIINGVRFAIYNLVVKNKTVVKYGTIILAFLLYNAYLATAIAYNRRNNIYWECCDGHGLLIILTVIVYWSLFYYHVLKRYFGKRIHQAMVKPVLNMSHKLLSRWYVRTGVVLAVIAGVAAFIIVDARDSPKRLVSAGGAIVMVVIGLIFSQHPGRVQWRQVLGGIAFQFIFGLLVLRWDGGRSFLDCVSRKVTRFLEFSNDGSGFIYGYLSTGIVNTTTSTGEPLNFAVQTLFAFQALSVIYFFSFFVGLLYHIGAMTWVVMKVGWCLQITLGTTAAESMNAAANIFLGQTEAPILVKPFLNDMTRSEIHAVMTGGFATIAGSVMAAYISFGVPASSLLTASLMAAPAALAMSKLLYPETKVSKTSSSAIKKISTKAEGNALDAAAQGAAQGFVLIGNIIANLIAVISFVAFLNAIIKWVGTLVGLVGEDELSFEWILGKIFVPFSFLLGVDSKDTEDVALLLGLKTVVNEFVAYQRLTTMTHLTARSKRLAAYALCSFANFSSVGIQLGGLGALAPLRRLDFSNVVWSALLAGTLATLLNTCIAGTLITDDIIDS